MKYRIIKALLITCIGLALVLPSIESKGSEGNKTEDTVKETVIEDNNDPAPKDDVEVNKDKESDKKDNKLDETNASDETETETEKDKNKQNTETNKTENVKQEETKQPENNEVVVEDNEQKPENNVEYKSYSIPSNSGFKSYMSYKALTSKSSPQYKLQSSYAYTGNHGIRQVNGRYCIAIGTFSNAKVGSYVDLVLENGTIIPCIVGDFKAPVHTDSSNIVTLHNGCVSEFIVDMNSLHSTAKRMGNISYCEESWKSPVKTIVVYSTNVLG